jgi:hypothetical protein
MTSASESSSDSSGRSAGNIPYSRSRSCPSSAMSALTKRSLAVQGGAVGGGGGAGLCGWNGGGAGTAVCFSLTGAYAHCKNKSHNSNLNKI